MGFMCNIGVASFIHCIDTLLLRLSRSRKGSTPVFFWGFHLMYLHVLAAPSNIFSHSIDGLASSKEKNTLGLENAPYIHPTFAFAPHFALILLGPSHTSSSTYPTTSSIYITKPSHPFTYLLTLPTHHTFTNIITDFVPPQWPSSRLLS